jgi:hypothetical protein
MGHLYSVCSRLVKWIFVTIKEVLEEIENDSIEKKRKANETATAIKFNHRISSMPMCTTSSSSNLSISNDNTLPVFRKDNSSSRIPMQLTSKYDLRFERNYSTLDNFFQVNNT